MTNTKPDDALLDALKAAEYTLQRMVYEAHASGLEGTSEWDRIVTRAGLNGTLASIRTVIAIAEEDAKEQTAAHGQFGVGA